MPGTPHAAPPPFFHALCARWAAGQATAYDTAVLTALTSTVALAAPHDPRPVGFDPTTRLPPTTSAHLFHDVKNAARVRHHAAATAAAELALSTALFSTVPSSTSCIPPCPTLSAAPARLGLLHATRSALGATSTIRWTLPRAVLRAAGPSFVLYVRAAGWIVETTMTDLEVGRQVAQEDEHVSFRSLPDLPDFKLLQMALELSRMPKEQSIVIPAGECVCDAPRQRAARARWPMRVLLRVRLAIDAYREVIVGVSAIAVVLALWRALG